MSWGNKSKNSWKIRSLLASKIIVQNNEMISSFYPKSNKISYIPRGVNIKDFPYEKKNYNLDKYKILYIEPVINIFGYIKIYNIL